MRKPVKSSSINWYKTVEGLPSVPIRGTRASTNRFPERSPIAPRMCDRSQRLRDVLCAVIFAVAQARLLATVNLRKEWLCKESTARPIRLLYTRASLMLPPPPSSSSREIRVAYKRPDYQGDWRASHFE